MTTAAIVTNTTTNVAARKQSTSCSTLHGSMRALPSAGAVTSGCHMMCGSSYHGSAGSVFESSASRSASRTASRSQSAPRPPAPTETPPPPPVAQPLFAPLTPPLTMHSFGGGGGGGGNNYKQQQQQQQNQHQSNGGDMPPIVDNGNSSTNGSCYDSDCAFIRSPDKATTNGAGSAATNGSSHHTNGDGAAPTAKTIERCTYEGCTYEYGHSSPEPIQWDLFASGDGDPNKNQCGYYQPDATMARTTTDSVSSSNDSQYRGPNGNAGKTSDASVWQTTHGGGVGSGGGETTNAVMYHHESATVENCCENLAFSGVHDEQDDDDAACSGGNLLELSVTEDELSAFFDKQLQRNGQPASAQQCRLNNAMDTHRQSTSTLSTATPSTTAAATAASASASVGSAAAAGGASSDIVLSRRNNIAAAITQLNLSPDFRHYEKITNLSQQQASNMTPNRFPSISAGGLNVYNANYCYNENSAAATNDKFATGSNGAAASGTMSTQDAFELFNISGGGGGGAGSLRNGDATTSSAAAISLTTQNVFETSMHQHHQHQHQHRRHRVSVEVQQQQQLQPDVSFFDLSDEPSHAWASNATSTSAQSAVDGTTTAAATQRQHRDCISNDALDAIVLDGSSGCRGVDEECGADGGGCSAQRSSGRNSGVGGFLGLFRNVRRRAKRYKGFEQQQSSGQPR